MKKTIENYYFFSLRKLFNLQIFLHKFTIDKSYSVRFFSNPHRMKCKNIEYGKWK